MRIYIFLFIGIFFSNALPGQAGSVSEAELKTQDKFLQAKQQQILGNLDDAVNIYKDLARKDAKNDVVLYELARIYLKQDKVEKALSAIQEAIIINDQNTWYHNLNADILLQKGQYLNAAVSYEKLIKLQPRISSHYTNLSYCYLRANEPAKAIKILDQIESKAGISEEYSRKKFEIYDRIGKENKAVEEIEKLIQQFPDEMAYRHILAVYHKKNGKDDKAKDVYTDILKLNPEDAKANIALADDFRKDGKDNNYLNSIKSIISNENIELDIKVQEMIPYVEKLNQQYDQELGNTLLELVGILNTVHPKEAKVYALQGDILNAKGEREAAFRSYKEAIKYDETVYSVWEQGMYILAELNDMEELVDFSESAMDVFPNQGFVYYMNGLGNNSMKNYDEALLMLDQVLLMSQKNKELRLETYSLLGNVYHQLERAKESNEAFEKALEINPSSITVKHNYSYYLAQRGEDLEKAKTMIEAANKSNPNHPKIQHVYGWVLYKMKDFSGAQKWLEKSLANGGSKRASVLEHYGDVLFESNKKEEALQYWEKALEQGGKSEILKKKIADKQLYP
jgi:tetratricopeptide (TPR) repeat protein